MIRHVSADKKWVLFEQSRRQVWRKVFLDLEGLEAMEGRQQEEAFEREVRPKIDEFISDPRVIDRVEVER